MLLVTGITGHSGRYFLKELINHKYKDKIKCIVRESSDTSLLDNSGLNIEKIVGDLDKEETIAKAMVGVDKVMHIYNIHHSPAVVKYSLQNKVSKVVLVHTTGIYSKYKKASHEYKKVEEKISNLLKQSKNAQINVNILRPTMIYGDLCDSNMSRFIKMIDYLRIMPVIENGKSLLQPVNARDLGKAYYKVLTKSEKITKNKKYILSGERPITMMEVFKLISDGLEKKTYFLSVPLNISVLMAKLLKFISLNKINYIERVQRMGEDRHYSHEQAAKDLGYQPMKFEDGIKREIEQYKKN